MAEFEKIITTDDAPLTPDDFRDWAAKLNVLVDSLNGNLAESNTRTKGDGTYQEKNATDGLWYTVWWEEVDGVNLRRVAATGEE